MITTTTELVQRAQLAADMHDGPFTPEQWMFFATRSNIALSVFLARAGWTQNVKTQTITVDGTEAGAFTLTSNPLAIVAIHQVGTDGNVRRIKLNNAVDFLHQTVASTATQGDPTEYRVLWDQDNDAYVVNFYPQPPSGTQFLVSYIPHPSKLVIGTAGAGEATSVKYPLGYEEWVVLEMAIAAKDTEESDTAGLERRFAKLQSTIEESVSDMVFAGATVRNVDNAERWWTRHITYPAPSEWWFV